jgi:NAD(P)-dependent dehydrogenase (short-subunit alcohol dehydrogenase family)
VVASVQHAHGPIDVLINNAGVQVRSMGIEADDREWDLWERGWRTRIRVWAAAESGRGHVGVRAILQVVNQVQQYERVPFLAADSRSRPQDRVSSTAIRRELHAPATRMVRDEPYSLGNGNG